VSAIEELGAAVGLIIDGGDGVAGVQEIQGLEHAGVGWALVAGGAKAMPPPATATAGFDRLAAPVVKDRGRVAAESEYGRLATGSRHCEQGIGFKREIFLDE
jgi:hypothetical protein